MPPKMCDRARVDEARPTAQPPYCAFSANASSDERVSAIALESLELLDERSDVTSVVATKGLRSRRADRRGGLAGEAEWAPIAHAE